jgi:hypothetical protein
MYILTFNCVRLHIPAASSFTDNVEMAFVHHISGSCIGSIALD